MPDNRVIDPKQVSIWQTNGLRLSAFPATTREDLASIEWWEDLIGEPPSAQMKKVRESVLQEEGPYRSGTLVLTASSPKIDWRYLPLVDIDASETLGGFYQESQSFLALMQKWLNSNNLIGFNRLAFGAVLLQPSNNLAESYRLLNKYIPLELDADNISDFRYQINRRRLSNIVNGLEINRLTKWGSITISLAALSASGEILQPAIGSMRVFSQLELDINSAPEFNNILPSDKLSELFEEFVELAYEIAVNGDTP